jgi:adenylate kinase
LRADDNPEALKKRLAAYRAQTAPLITYYRDKGVLATVNGMAPIPEVASAIDRLLRSTRPRNAAGRKSVSTHGREGGAAQERPGQNQRCQKQVANGKNQNRSSKPPQA